MKPFLIRVKMKAMVCKSNTLGWRAVSRFVFSPWITCKYVFVSLRCCMLLSVHERLCVHAHTHTHIHLMEQQCRGQDWCILLRAHRDLWWEQVGLLNLDVLAGWLADLELQVGSKHDDGLGLWWLTTLQTYWLHACLQGGLTGRPAACFATFSLTDWEADW